MKKFTKTIALKNVPADAKKFPNGDILVKLEEYTLKQGKRQEQFGYYKPTKTGFALEKLCWRANVANQYNWAKNQPGFKPGGKSKKAAAKEVKAASKPKVSKSLTKDQLVEKMMEMQEALAKYQTGDVKEQA